VLIRTTQEELRTCLRHLVQDGYTLVPKVSAELALVRDEAGQIHQRVVSGSALATFFAMVAELLCALGSALRRCARDPCTNFVAALGHTRYCSGACSRRAITKRYNMKNREVILARKRKAREDERALRVGDAVPLPRRVRRPRAKGGGANGP
jgi:hypothetical protein